jgi:DNA-binding NtrC family response regulator
MSPALQTKLLRVLQEGEIRRIGGSETVRVDVRVLASTNRPLHGPDSSGSFRADLYYRLNCVAIHVPPLREHLQDVVDLAHHFISLYTPPGQTRPALDALAVRKLQSYHWPGNVRDLENTIRRALVLGNPSVILANDLQFAEGEAVTTPAPPDASSAACEVSSSRQKGDELLELALHRWLASRPDSRTQSLVAILERRLVAAALCHTAGNQTQTARLLGISRSTLRDWLKQQRDPDPS